MKSRKKIGTYQKNGPSILLVEGLWGAGKSTLISYIRARYRVLFVSEPNFQTSRIKTGISEWYKKQHQNRLKNALEYVRCGEHVVMERSILSSAAFYYAKYAKMPSWFDLSRSPLLSIPCLYIVFLYTDKRTFMRNARYIKDESVRAAIKSHGSFYENYLDFFKKIGLSVLFIESGVYPRSKSIDSYFRKIFQTKMKSKFQEVTHHCSSAVVLFKNKLLIIYSRKHRQFTLPQGHQKNGEGPEQTIFREITEETGYMDLDLIRHLRTYSFRFHIGSAVIRKCIDCYLIMLKSLRSTKKRLEDHETYKNFLVSREAGLRMLNWPEDRENVMRAYDIYTKKPRLLRKRG